ncbi:MAG: DNA-directed RNA polymerase subunit beta, partial [Chloroflexota bacterium]|nr:DNA-directed RNA polymerase subunit beta [Chloroflexota bacterium]
MAVESTSMTGAATHAVGAQQVISNIGIGRKSYADIQTVLEMPNLVQIQLDSFNWFITKGLEELLREVSPITDHHDKMQLHLSEPRFDEPWERLPEGEIRERAKRDPRVAEVYCRERDMTYSARLRISAKLVINETGEVKETGPDGIFIGDFPVMTSDGTFIINGAERVVVSQLVRSPGAYFERKPDPATGRLLSTAKLIPNRGAWLEFETSNRDVISVKIDRKRKMPVTILLRALGYETDDELLALFSDVDTSETRRFIQSTLEKEPTKSQDEALVELYRRMRPGDPPTRDNAERTLTDLFFNERRYDLARVGRHKLNQRLHQDDEVQTDSRILEKEDLVEIVRELIRLNNGQSHPDDIDHLGNRRIRAVGELIQMHVRTGFQRLERGIKERMTIQDIETVTPQSLISTTRPVIAAVREFFGGSQLSQFMDQTNPLAELTHKRRLSALGPGGLSRDRAGMDVRDVHPSHYGRICPVETPEGPNIGLIGYLATYGKINDFGFIETPYRRVVSTLSLDDPALPLEGQILRDNAVNSETDEVVVEAGTTLDAAQIEKMRSSNVKQVRIRPVVSGIIDYLSADREEGKLIAQADTPLDEDNRIAVDWVTVRRVAEGHTFPQVRPEQVEYMDVSPKQVISVATALIPFLEHDDANRALMGANMQRQAVPLVRPQSPIIGTGVEHLAARDSGQVIV